MNKLTASLLGCPRDIPKACPQGEKLPTDVRIKSNGKSRDSGQNIPKRWAVSETASPLFVLWSVWINAPSSLFWTWSSQVYCSFRTKFNIGGIAADQALQGQARLLLFEMGDSSSYRMWTRSLWGMDPSSPKRAGLRRTESRRRCHCKASRSALPEERCLAPAKTRTPSLRILRNLPQSIHLPTQYPLPAQGLGTQRHQSGVLQELPRPGWAAL